MSDFFDRFERELVEAARRLGPEQAPRWRRLANRRFAVALVLVLTLSGGALAATQPWAPAGLTHSRFPAPAISAQAPLASELRMLAVLRRAPTAADRSKAVARIAGFSGSPRSTRGVRTNYIRRVGTTMAGAPIVLVPLRDWRPGGSIDKPNALCLIYPEREIAQDSAAKGCWTEAEVRAGKAFASLGTHICGLAPDGVASVLVLFGAGRAITAPVHDNFYDVSGPLDRRSRTPTARAPTAIGWLDANGNPAGP